MTNMDRLYQNVAQRGIVCLGLDTSPTYLPENFAASFETPGAAVFEFNRRIIDATSKAVACYKIQIAYYEALGLDGLKAFADTLRYIKSIGQLAITDCKRGDIAETAAMYAKAHFSGDFESDFVTLNPYMGLDTLQPFDKYFEEGKGCFVLLRTSNPGARDIQYLELAGGGKVFEHLGERLQEYGERYIGSSGYSSVGMVIGATHIEGSSRDEAAALREKLSATFMLIPGFGAQGGAAKDAAMYLRRSGAAPNGVNALNGGVVNSSRAILTAYKKHADGAERFADYALAEVIAMNRAILECAYEK